MIKKNNSENVSTQKNELQRRLCAQTPDLQIFKKFDMSQFNTKEFVHCILSLNTLHGRSVPLSFFLCVVY